MELTAAEILDSPPPGEAVIAIPPEGSGSGRERAYVRIGLGDASWIGTFEIGYTKVGSISMMPDNKHLFVSAKGAGYIIDLKSRTLVEQVGTHVAFVRMDAPRTLFLVDHNGMSLELFGTNGRLWKTDIISSGGFREISLEDNIIAGEAMRGSPEEWVRFSADVATGEVRFEDAGLRKAMAREATTGGQTTRRGGRDGAVEKAPQADSLLAFFQSAPAGLLVLDLKRKRDKTREISDGSGAFRLPTRYECRLRTHEAASGPSKSDNSIPLNSLHLRTRVRGRRRLSVFAMRSASY